MDSGWDFTALISIHAPPRGATAGGNGKENCDAISIHAPPRGATIAAEATTVRPYYFNSRPSARGDPPRGRRSHKTWISIHAPPRGATCISNAVLLTC